MFTCRIDIIEWVKWIKKWMISYGQNIRLIWCADLYSPSLSDYARFCDPPHHPDYTRFWTLLVISIHVYTNFIIWVHWNVIVTQHLYFLQATITVWFVLDLQSKLKLNSIRKSQIKYHRLSLRDLSIEWLQIGGHYFMNGY